ncbi:hypothetical protein VII00023_16025 [Vibrio ichthyoenteri ATCC 700023]|uniref:Uncharacterized protein n=1 Tax=Vibrio ichthyoenteri ATCC 700023 TaxID=870968 RepID=F9S350_9VIBR|nr:hypothetical protein VII00023_16025 [Vibrio ichthyoenteri ATCC 700023]
MLGESHSLLADFPEMEDAITTLMKNDESFAQAMKDYNALVKKFGC